MPAITLPAQGTDTRINILDRYYVVAVPMPGEMP